MNELLKKFLESIGVPADVIEALAADEQPDGFDIQQAVEGYRTNQEAVYSKRSSKSIEDKIKEAKLVEQKLMAGKLAKEFGLITEDFSRRKAEDMEMDAFLKYAKAEIQKRIDGAGTEGTEDLRNKINTYQSKVQELTTQLEGLESKYEEDLAAERNKAAAEIRSFKVNDLFNRRFAGVEWGIDEALRDIVQDRIRQEITSRYHVDESDGMIFDRDGKSKAVNYAENGTYVSVDEPIKFLLEKYNAVKKSNGGVQSAQQGNGGPAKPGSGTPTSDTLSPAARALKERIEAAQKRPYGT